MYKQLKMYGDMVRLVKQFFPEHLDATHLQLAKVSDCTVIHVCIQYFSVFLHHCEDVIYWSSWNLDHDRFASFPPLVSMPLSPLPLSSHPLPFLFSLLLFPFLLPSLPCISCLLFPFAVFFAVPYLPFFPVIFTLFFFPAPSPGLHFFRFCLFSLPAVLPHFSSPSPPIFFSGMCRVSISIACCRSAAACWCFYVLVKVSTPWLKITRH